MLQADFQNKRSHELAQRMLKGTTETEGNQSHLLGAEIQVLGKLPFTPPLMQGEEAGPFFFLFSYLASIV